MYSVVTAFTGQRDKPTRQDDKHDTSILVTAVIDLHHLSLYPKLFHI